MTYYTDLLSKILLYCAQLSLGIVLALVAVFFGWAIAFFVDQKTGHLPYWLKWFETVDASCYDEQWVAEHPNWSKYKIAATWIARNPAYGYNRWCSVPTLLSDTALKTSGDLDIADGEKGKAGFFFLSTETGYWNLSYVLSIGRGTCLRGELGWYLLPIAKKYDSVNTGMLQTSPFRLYAFGEKGN